MRQKYVIINNNGHKIILVKAKSNRGIPTSTYKPNQFPTPPAPTGNRPSSSIYVPEGRTAPGVVPKLAGRRNPNDNGGNANGKGNGAGANWISEDDNMCPSKEQLKKPEIPYYQKKRRHLMINAR